MSATSGVRPEVYAATAPPIAATAPSDTSARTSKPGDVLRRDRELMRMSRKVGPLARRVKRDYRLAHASHHRILRRLKLRAQGRRSGGRNPEDLSARRREADSIVGGVFEVEVDGRRIFSKKSLGRHAEPGEVVRLIKQASG